MSSEFITALKSCAAVPRLASPAGGQGIVICAGGLRLFTCAYVLLRVLRETLSCRLPIQLWHFGGEELSPVMRRLLVASDVELVDATAVLEEFPADINDGWQLKVYAILHSRFSEVLLLDADQVPVRDPACVFDMPEYARSGAVFWPDIIDIRADNPIWKLVGLPGESCPSWESGQVLVDKRRHWPSLQTALYLNEHAEVVYRMVYGDKDTFLVAWRVTGADVAVVPYRPFNDYKVLVQRDFGGAPLFQHRTGAKWNYHDNQYYLSGFTHMDACLRFLDNLRKAWNGRLFFPPDRSFAARTEEERLEQVERVRLTLLGDQEIELQLMPGHQIGAGRSNDRQNWYVTENGTSLELILHDGDRVTNRIRPAQDGLWLGEQLSTPYSSIRMDERPTTRPVEHDIGSNGLVDSLVDASGFAATNSAQARARLVSTLHLLVRAEPGVRPAIVNLGLRLPELADVVRDVLAMENPQRPSPVVIATGVMEAGYDRSGGVNL
jgi:hypothetical protein